MESQAAWSTYRSQGMRREGGGLPSEIKVSNNSITLEAASGNNSNN